MQVNWINEEKCIETMGNLIIFKVYSTLSNHPIISQYSNIIRRFNIVFKLSNAINKIKAYNITCQYALPIEISY